MTDLKPIHLHAESVEVVEDGVGQSVFKFSSVRGPVVVEAHDNLENRVRRGGLRHEPTVRPSNEHPPSTAHLPLHPRPAPPAGDAPPAPDPAYVTETARPHPVNTRQRARASPGSIGLQRHTVAKSVCPPRSAEGPYAWRGSADEEEVGEVDGQTELGQESTPDGASEPSSVRTGSARQGRSGDWDPDSAWSRLRDPKATPLDHLAVCGSILEFVSRERHRAVLEARAIALSWSQIAAGLGQTSSGAQRLHDRAREAVARGVLSGPSDEEVQRLKRRAFGRRTADLERRSVDAEAQIAQLESQLDRASMHIESLRQQLSEARQAADRRPGESRQQRRSRQRKTR